MSTALSSNDIWYNSHDNLVGFGGVLDDAGFFANTKDLLYFFEKPWKWGAEYVIWESFGKPDREDPNWIAFSDQIAALSV